MAHVVLHAVDVDAEPKQVIDAISTEEGEKAFWVADCDIRPEVGSEAVFRFRSAPVPARMRIDEIGADRVAWTCTGDFPYWEGTRLTWETRPSDSGQGIRVTFRHDGWPEDWPEHEFASVNFVWGQVLGRLKGFLETGQPQPFFP